MAIIGVIVSHVFLIWSNAEVINFKIISFRQIFMYAVPLFLMLSGALLLNRNIELGDFFKTRLTRIITPFIFYMIVYVGILYFVMNTFVGFEGISTYLAKVPFEYNWYFWLILGIYITLPVINKFVQHSDLKELEYFIAVLFIGSLFYQITFILGITHYVNLNLVLCPVAYLVLGYYLSVKEFRMSKNRIISIAIVLFIIVSIIKILAVDGYIPFEYVTGYDITSSPRVATQVDLGIFELFRTSALFLIFKCIFDTKKGIYSKIRNIFESETLTRIYTSISKASYGMYLFHVTIFVILKIMLAKLPLSGTQVCLLIVILMFGLNIAAWIAVLIINRIPIVNKFSGYH